MIINQDESISVFLNRIHKEMYGKFLSKGRGGNKSDAQFLQTFLSDLKSYAGAKQTSGEINIKALELVYTSTKEEIDKNPNLQGFNHALFRNSYNNDVEPFEQELAHVVDAVLANVAKNPEKLQNIFEQTFIGNKVANVEGIQVDSFAKEVLQQMSTETQRLIKTGKNKGKIFQRDYVDISAKQGKIDVKGVEIEVSAQANQDLLKVYNILSKSTFSAKNYKSYYYVTEKTESWMNMLGLGQSNPFKAYWSILSLMGYQADTINYSFNRAYFCWKNHSLIHENTGNAIFAIRQMYELIGIGLVYTSGDFGGVDYLIYNEHNTNNIYVKSVKEILQHFQNYQYRYKNPFTDKIVIEKEFFV